MAIKSSDPIYTLLERALSQETPQTCAELLEISEIREALTARFGTDIQAATNHVSNTLGFMWRRGVAHRYPAPKNSTSKAWYAYNMKTVEITEPIPIQPLVRHKPTFTITESDKDVTLEFDHVTIIVRRK